MNHNSLPVLCTLLQVLCKRNLQTHTYQTQWVHMKSVNTSSSARTVPSAKTLVITQLLTYLTAFTGGHSIPCIHCPWFNMLCSFVWINIFFPYFDFITVLLFVPGLSSLHISVRDVPFGMCLLGSPCILRNVILETKWVTMFKPRHFFVINFYQLTWNEIVDSLEWTMSQYIGYILGGKNYKYNML